jgi:hypothetical protein
VVKVQAVALSSVRTPIEGQHVSSQEIAEGCENGQRHAQTSSLSEGEYLGYGLVWCVVRRLVHAHAYILADFREKQTTLFAVAFHPSLSLTLWDARQLPCFGCGVS